MKYLLKTFIISLLFIVISLFNPSPTFAAPAISTTKIFKKVYVLIFNPTVDTSGTRLIAKQNWSDPVDLSNQAVSIFNKDSHGILNYSIVKTTIVNDFNPMMGGYTFTPEKYYNCLHQTNCDAPSGADYTKILNTYDICNLVNKGEIDELWMWGGPYFGYYESELAGKNGYWYNSPALNMPACNKLIPVMGLNYERQITEEIHSFGHRMESTMEHVYGGWDMNSTTTNWDIFSQNSKNSPSTTTYGCGNVHFPPNADSDYDYSNTKSVKTDCDEFTINWPTIDKKASIKTVTCSTWGCTERGYQDWWYTHLPAYEGIAPDGVYANWWIYFSDPNTALTKAVCTKTCSNKSCGQSDGCGGICIVDTSCKTKENSCIDDHTLRQYSASSCSSKGVCSDSYTDLTCTYGCNTTEVACNPQPDDNTPPVVPPIDTNNTGNTNTQQNTTTQNDLSTIMELIQSNIIAILIVGGAVITLTAIVILLYIFRKKMFSSFNRKQEIKNDVETPTKA